MDQYDDEGGPDGNHCCTQQCMKDTSQVSWEDYLLISFLSICRLSPHTLAILFAEDPVSRGAGQLLLLKNGILLRFTYSGVKSLLNQALFPWKRLIISTVASGAQGTIVPKLCKYKMEIMVPGLI